MTGLYSILSFKIGDVTGDTNLNRVFLFGIKDSQSANFATTISILVEVELPVKQINIPLFYPYNQGYNASMFLGRFTFDNLEQILVSIKIQERKEEIYAYMYQIIDYSPSLIFDFNYFNRNSVYIAKFKDFFLVDIIRTVDNFKLGEIYVGERKEEYIKQGIYSSDGKLIVPISGGSLGLSDLTPYVPNYDKEFNLVAKQDVIGVDSTDIIAKVYSYLKWDGSTYQIGFVNLMIV